MEDVELKIKNIISKQLGVNIENIENNMRFVDDLGGDSLDTVEMLLSLEDEFNVNIDEEIAETITTVQTAIDYVKKFK